jgi:very-short-patch-repair endonuclease
MTEAQEKQALSMYTTEQKSPYEIPRELGTYPNKIRRLLMLSNIEIRDKSESQSLALKRGVRKHPTAGKQRDEKTKLKISEKMARVWSETSVEERERRAEQAKTQWEAMSIEQRENLQTLAAKAIRVAAKDGSKLEKSLLKSLTESGFEVQFHREGLIPNEKLQLDLFIPKQNVAIEVDGPSHFYPIWGDESLKKHLKADAEKTGLLISKGFSIIRVKCISKTVSQSKQRALTLAIVEIVKNIKNKLGATLYEIEV